MDRRAHDLQVAEPGRHQDLNNIGLAGKGAGMEIQEVYVMIVGEATERKQCETPVEKPKIQVENSSLMVVQQGCYSSLGVRT